MAMRLPLALRAILATLIPILVAFIGPWVALGGALPMPASYWRLIFLVPMLLGIALLAWCIVIFAQYGRGTLAPLDPPTVFVARGPYLVTRNPMYVGVSSWLLGVAALTDARLLWWYALITMAAFHFFVRLVEEPLLRRRFGATYDDYTRNVPRWLGRRRGTLPS